MSAKSQLKKEIREAYLFLREKNQTIPSDTLEFMLNAALEKADSLPEPEFDFVDDKVEKVETLKHLNLNDEEKKFAAHIINHYGSGQHPIADERTTDGFTIKYLKDLLTKAVNQSPKMSDFALGLVKSIEEKIEKYVTN